MKEKAASAEQVIASLFEGQSRLEQMALLSRLEYGGASMYRAWAASERNAKAREALLAGAEREEANGKILRLMSTPKSECEKCHKRLPLETAVLSCSFQCTFCAECGAGYHNVCPNCGGELAARSA